jgi:serine/threonine-protein kinase HipA
MGGNITRDDLLTVADRFGVGTAKKVIDRVKTIVASWPDYAKAAEVRASETSEIRSHHRLL